ncbi:MAG: N-acetyl-gamma-glutamyl-phosphate reductase, partial [Plesiomonas shigelloides]
MLNTLIIGASGYTGAELAAMVLRHPNLTLGGLFVSEGSRDAGR